VADRGGDGARGAQQAAGRGELALEGVDRADQPLGHPDRGLGVDQLAPQLLGPRPLAALAQDVDEAGDAGDFGAGVAVGAAEVEGGVERLLGAAVVGAVVEDEAEPLVELGGDGGEVVLERQRQAGLDRGEPGLELAALRLRHSLQPEQAGAQVGPLGRRRFLDREVRQLDRLRVAGAAAMVVSHRQALQRRLLGLAGRGKGVGREAAGGEGAVALAAQLVGAGKAPLRLRVTRLVAASIAFGSQLPPGFRRVGEIAGELGAAPV
jgi:hypothetical protein